MEIDGHAALRCWAVTLSLGGQEHRIAPRPAVDWITTAVINQDWLSIVPGWLDDAQRADDAFLDGAVGYEELLRSARDALGAAGGAPWWSVVRLLSAGLGEPTVMGGLALAGVDLGRVPLGAVTAAVYHIYTRRASLQQKARLDAELDRLPQGVNAAERFDEGQMAEAFERMYASRGGGAR